MARFIPVINLEQISNPSERKVASLLANHLSDQVNVIHSFNWVHKRDSGILVEGECDFIVLDPHNGLLFVEVKGGIVGFDPQTEEWWRLSRYNTKIPLNKDPFKQVQHNMYAIVDHIKEQLKLPQLDCTYGFAVIFPDGRFQGQVPPSITRAQIIDATDMAKIETRLARIFSLFRRSSNMKLTRAQARKIEFTLFPKFDIVPVLWRKIEDQEERLHRLTEEQKNLLEVLTNQSMASIQGGAGTGKTLLALAKAQQAAKAGMRTLLLCYNRPLRNWLSHTAQADFEHELAIKTYHELAHDYCTAANIEFNPDQYNKPRDFWNEIAPDLLMRACDLLPECEKYDAVIVDEGQDFQELWWHSLDSIFKDPQNKGCFYVFFDPNQILYLKEQLRLPSELGEPFLLQQNCRNSPEIARYCESLIGLESDHPTHSLDVFCVDSRQSGFQKITELISELSAPKTGELCPSQIVVLVPGFPLDDLPSKFRRIKATRDLNAWRNDEGVLIESYARFKGLEADAVIILTAPIGDTNGRDRRLNYVACSRAKHILKIVEVVDGR